MQNRDFDRIKLRINRAAELFFEFQREFLENIGSS
jgi:hypothetical protein